VFAASLACPLLPLAHAAVCPRIDRSSGAMEDRPAMASEGDPGERQAEFTPEEAVALAEALVRLERHDPRAAEVTRLRFFAGLSVEETAEALGLTVRTVHREWTYARARLFEWLGESEPPRAMETEER